MKRLILAALVVSLLFVLMPRAVVHAVPASPIATLIVNSTADTNSRDSVLTLREAILIARGDLSTCLTDAEMAQIFDASWGGSPNCNNIIGGVGFYDSDWIIFAGGVGTISPTSGLPHLYCNDWISSSFGTSRTVTLDGSGAGSVDGIIVECPTPSSVLGGFAIQYLSITGFDNDIKVMGAYTGTLKGLAVADACHSGIVLSSDNARQRNSRNNVIGGTTVTDRNYIYHNGFGASCGPGDGIRISADTNFDSGLMSNQIIGNYIGLNTGGTASGNERYGIFLLHAWYNAIGGPTPASGNVLSANGSDGIKLLGADTTGNGIYNNIIGLNPAATVTLGNNFSGISMVDGAHDNLIGSLVSNGNTIAGNEWGVYIGNFGSNSNSVAYNTIGTNAAGAAGLGNTVAGVGLYDNVAFNDIGTNGGNTISGNAIGVEIKDSGTNYNYIANNRIGLNSAGNGAVANVTGIKLSGGVHFNDVNFNTISGNTTVGVLIDGAGTLSNTLRSNKIGTNSTGTAAVPNTLIGVKIQNGASQNSIGLGGFGNLISGNGGDGVQISGANSNMLYANTIGLNASANAKLPNTYSGVAIFGANTNRVGGAGKGNVIAGNGNAGVFIANPNTISNFVFGNTIGTNASSASGLGNTNAGVGIYGGATFTFVGETNIVTEGAGNVISGNGGPGVDIANSGTRYNGVYANLIGTNAAGTAALPNGIGVRLFGGTTNNTIGLSTNGHGNVISGNASAGVGLYNTGTATNTVQKNIIGGDASALSPLPNTLYGVVIQEGAAGNTVDTNLIHSNGQHGIYLNNAGTSGNAIRYNRIGTTGINSAVNRGNGGSGIYFDTGSTNNIVISNTIAFNAGAGITVRPGSNGNSFWYLNEYSNGGLGIDLANPTGVGCTDGSGGGNQCVAAPVITAASNGHVNGAALPSAVILVYASSGDASGYGEGKNYLAVAVSDITGTWRADFNYDLCANYTSPFSVTATTKTTSGTSEFSQNVTVACSANSTIYLPLIRR